jgi:PAS domain S-box-containing protein
LVDDRAENLFALEIILSNENYACVKASSGKEALEILDKEHEFAIILMDVQMPMMDGFETVELIRQKEKLKHVPIIFLTANMDAPGHVFKGYQAGAVDFMIKPISPDILRAKVAVFVDLYNKKHELLIQAEEMKMLISDVTAQKLLAKYSLSLIEASHDPLFAIGTDGKITDMNNASIKVTGVSRRKLIGSHFHDYFTEPEKARAVYLQIFDKGFVVDFPLTIKDGVLTKVLFNGSVYKDEKGIVLGVVMVARDITEQKRFENELIESKNKAEQATLKAEESTKLKEAYLANMSHEIRTPMNAIIGFSDILFKSQLQAMEKEYVKIIKYSGENLLTIINDILDI